MMFIIHAKKLCDIIGYDTGTWAIIVTCSVNDGIFVQNECARTDYVILDDKFRSRY